MPRIKRVQQRLAKQSVFAPNAAKVVSAAAKQVFAPANLASASAASTRQDAAKRENHAAPIKRNAAALRPPLNAPKRVLAVARHVA